MKSELFSRFDVISSENNQFKIDLENILSVPEEKLIKIIRIIPEFHNERIAERKREIIDKITSETQLTEFDVQRIFRLTQFLASSVDDQSNTTDIPQQWADDLVATNVISQGEREVFIKFATIIINEISPALQNLGRQKGYSFGVFPTIVAVGATTELRAVQVNKFVLGSPLEDYSPKFQEIIPIISIKLKFSEGYPEEISFQVSPEELKYIIDALKSSLIDVEHLLECTTFSQLEK